MQTHFLKGQLPSFVLSKLAAQGLAKQPVFFSSPVWRSPALWHDSEPCSTSGVIEVIFPSNML